MECRTFTVKLVSATDLENVRQRFRMKVYAKVSIHGIKHATVCTPVDKEHGTDPVWNHPVQYIIDEASIQNKDIMLVVELHCKRKMGDRLIGEVRTPIKQLLVQSQLGSPVKEIRYMVENSRGTSKGELTLSCSFGEKMVKEETRFWKLTTFQSMPGGVLQIIGIAVAVVGIVVGV